MTPTRSEALAGGGIAHGFFGRRGGVSTGIYDALNCGFGSSDATEAVRENRSRVAASMELDEPALLTLNQVHSADVVVVDEGWRPGAAPRADAMVTRHPGRALGILTADCTPVLLADTQAGVVGAAHAGWKGARAGVVEATVAAMERLGAVRRRIHAAIGPCIRQPSYEVGPELRVGFVADSADNDRFFRPAARARHYLFDLAGFVAARLATAGIGTVTDVGLDTYAMSDAYFSYRRATHRGETDYGRAVSVITITERRGRT